MKYACQVYTHTVYETHMDKNLMVGWLPLPSQILCTTVKQEESARERALCQLTECF